MEQMIKICNILLPYCTEIQKLYGFWAEHDILGFTVDPEDISPEDMEELDKLGVFYSEEYDSLIKFV